MFSAAALRLEIETALAARVPGALTPRKRIVREMATTGVEELDVLLHGGFPLGAISELVGPCSSGRTTLALAAMAEMTQAGKSVAWIDASDAFDPESAAAAGVELARQLWVRCGQERHITPLQTGLQSQVAAGQGAAFLAESSRVPGVSGGCGSPHPRGEARGLSAAVDAFLHPDVFSQPAPPRDPTVPRRDRTIGTPGAPNRKVLDRTPQDARPLPRRARNREEQIPTDRQPSRRQTLHMQQRQMAQKKDLGAQQIANTAAAAAKRPRAGVWTDNQNNAAGRSLATPPNAIAAGLPRFRDLADRANSSALPQHELQTKSSLQPIRVEPSRTSAQQKAGPTLQAGVLSAVTERQRPTQVSAARTSALVPGYRASPVWQALDQALRSTDLLLSGGGFSAVVLDLGNVPPEFAWRVPLATWFRFRSAADRARTVFLLLTQHPCARSSAELVLRLAPVEVRGATTLFKEARFRVTVDRQRFETPLPQHVAPQVSSPTKLHLVTPRKQPQSERAVMWRRAAAWAAMKQESVQGGS